MAGDWIKMRADLFTHPKVVRISSALKADSLRTVGGLMSAWCLFDAHSIDGTLEGYDSDTLDAHLRWPGFAAAMIAVGWLVDNSGSLSLPRFEAHNGQSAKRRAQDADRKKNVRNPSASEADKKRTREEKRREENKDTPIVPKGDESADSGFDGILSAYHAILPNCQRIAVMTDKRKRLFREAVKLAKRICRERCWDYGDDFWRDYFTECAKDPWRRGEVANPNNAAWRQSIDVLLRDDQFAKVMDSALGGGQ